MRRIIITGAAGGIGQAAVRALASDDAILVCVDVAGESLGDFLRAVEPLPGQRVAHVSDLATVAAARAAVAAAGGPVAGLVHLAGVFEPDPEPLDDPSVYERAIAHNLTNAYLLANAVHERRDPDRVGAMVFATSLAFRRGSYEHVPYAAAKGGLVGMTRALSRRFAPAVRVNAIAPGFIDTSMPRRVLASRGERILAEIPLRRVGTPAEAASVIEFLVSDRSAYITGQVINVDGGMINS